ncbi:hypothetical protein OEZ85_007238 [Tetradesmus obliquus]|uniref:Magnesium transporter MgtE intracellular domain-containing protein n=1 Tax=Tetradesmus obliquus TaxID=3088 RepID=A0ABY8TWZ3_TETOB|nr:hypothetical protein OEZ85_007238 [Tetradesmus obliquus]
METPEKPGIKSNKPQTPAIASVKPGELPSVLRTSADLGSSSKQPGTATAAGAAQHGHAGAKHDTAADKQLAGARGSNSVPSADLLSTALLPRLDSLSAAQQHALPSRPALSASPPRPNRSTLSPERHREAGKHSSRDASSPAAAAGAPAAKQAANAALRRSCPTASSSKKAADGAPAVGSVAMTALPASYYRQLLQEFAGPGDLLPASHTRQRMSMLLRLPLGTEHFLSAVPAAIQDRSGHACLLVLPSDQPSNRKEALAVEELLAQLLQDPATAVAKACQWRAAVLAALCSDSLGAVAEALKEKGPPRSWQFKQQQAGLSSQVLGSDMAEALDSLMTSSEVSTTAAKMASLINIKEANVQVEVACVERGRALVCAWNCSMGAAESALVELQAQNRQLLRLNSKLVDDQQELAKELKGVDFLRREAMRFRKELEEAQAAAAGSSADNSALRARLEVAESQVAAVEAFTRKRLARLRWRNAFAVLGTWSRQSTIQSGGQRSSKAPGQLLAKVVMLEKMVNAVNSVEHRKLAWGRNQKMEKFEFNRPQMSDMVQVMTLGPQVAAPGRVHDGYNIDSTVQMLTALTPEARTMVLATMPPVQRWKVVEAMKDEERAAMVIAMSVGLRKEAAAAVDGRLWERTMDIIKNHSGHAARYLTSMDIDDAAAEFLGWGTFQQVDALGSTDTYTAAALLTRSPEPLRKELLGMLEPYMAANIVQAMMPPPAASSVDALDVKKAMAILMAMDPSKAADILTEMGASKAASKLMHMDADARNSIIESMAPRAAAVTLASMEDALQQAQDGRPDSPELLSLTGGSNMESPVMDTMMELDAANAYSIMSYMSVQDKAALLANMDPNAVARLLGLMDPNEAVVLLAALGDGNARLVGQALSSEERNCMVQVLQSADCQAGDSFAARARQKGSFRDHEPETVQRLVDAYETIEAGAMDGGDEEPSAARRSTQEVLNSARRTPRTPPNNRSRLQLRSVGVQAGAGLADSTMQGSGEADTGGNAGAAVAAAAAAAAAGGGGGGGGAGVRSRARTASNIGYIDDDAADAAAGGSGRANANGKANRARAAAGEAGKKAPVNAKRAEERQLSGDVAESEAETALEASAGEAPIQAAAKQKGSKAAAAGTAAKPAAGSAAGASSSTNSKARRRSRMSERGDDKVPAPSQRSSQIGAAAAAAALPEVPLLPLSAAAVHDDSTDFEETPPSSSRPLRYDDEGEDAPSGDSTPRTAAAAGASAAARRAGKSAAASAAAGRKALREALKSQAAAKQKGGAAGRAGAGASGGSKDANQSAAAEDDAGDASGATGAAAPAAALSEAPAQARLGRLPKNARLIEAMAQHKNAKPKPKGWLMAVVESIYKEGETLLRKLGRADMIKKQSVPEIVFAYFHNKYGQRALVNENVGSLVNTLALHQRSDLRLEAFARLLSEEWDVSIFLDFLNAQALCMQPAKLACIEYPREPSKDEAYAWVCLYKAVWVADAVLGMRAQAARNRFNEFLHMASVPADEADVERLRRERREAAAKDAKGAAGGGAKEEELPESFYKLPRIRFLLILCKEILRINKFIASFGEERFAALDAQRCGIVSVVLARGFVKAMSPAATDAQVSDNINVFVSTAEGFVRDMPPEQVAVPSVTELSREAFVAGVTGTAVVREHIKLNLLHPARLEEDDAEAQVFFSLLAVLLTRHSSALLPYWQAALDAAGDRARALQAQLAGVTAAGAAGDARLKAYVNLLLGLINTSTQGYLDSLLGADADVEALASDQLEGGLVRLEDAALLLVGGCGGIEYLLEEQDPQLALARMQRLPLGGRIKAMGQQLLRHRRMEPAMVENAANVLQRVWRRRQLQRQEQQQALGEA